MKTCGQPPGRTSRVGLGGHFYVHRSVQNFSFSDSVRSWGETKFISSKADFLTPENLLQDIRKCCSVSIHAEVDGLCPDPGEHKSPRGSP